VLIRRNRSSRSVRGNKGAGRLAMGKEGEGMAMKKPHGAVGGGGDSGQGEFCHLLSTGEPCDQKGGASSLKKEGSRKEKKIAFILKKGSHQLEKRKKSS